MADIIREEVISLHAQICSGMADPNRIMIIYSLADSPRNVTEIAAVVKLPQPTVSRHLKILRECGIVRSVREGQTIIYRLSDKRVVQALDLLRATLGDMFTDQAELARQLKENSSI